MCEYCEKAKELVTPKIRNKTQYILKIENFNNNGIYKIKFYSKENNREGKKLLFQSNLKFCPFCGENLRKM